MKMWTAAFEVRFIACMFIASQLAFSTQGVVFLLFLLLINGKSQHTWMGHTIIIVVMCSVPQKMFPEKILYNKAEQKVDKYYGN